MRGNTRGGTTHKERKSEVPNGDSYLPLHQREAGFQGLLHPEKTGRGVKRRSPTTEKSGRGRFPDLKSVDYSDQVKTSGIPCDRRKGKTRNRIKGYASQKKTVGGEPGCTQHHTPCEGRGSKELLLN